MMRPIVFVPDLDMQKCFLQIKKQIKKGFEDCYDYDYKMVYIKVKGNKDEISCYIIFRANCK